jgi:hypothetical protein
MQQVDDRDGQFHPPDSAPPQHTPPILSLLLQHFLAEHMELKKLLSDLDSMDVDKDPVAFTRQVGGWVSP